MNDGPLSNLSERENDNLQAEITLLAVVFLFTVGIGNGMITITGLRSMIGAVKEGLGFGLLGLLLGLRLNVNSFFLSKG